MVAQPYDFQRPDGEYAALELRVEEHLCMGTPASLPIHAFAPTTYN